MENIRTLVVDDEIPAQARILELLGKQPDIEVIGVGRTGSEAIQMVRTMTPDLMFLDVQMPGMDGFEMLRELTPQTPLPSVIFVTGYDRYALNAFEANALDYLLKPYSDERFEAALQRGRNVIRHRAVGELGLQFARLLEGQASPHDDSPHLERVLIRSAGRVTFLDVSDIDWIEAAGVYVELHAGQKTHLYRATVGQLHERLDPKRFVRVHRSTIVNTSRIVELHPRTHGDYIVVLKGGIELTLSRGYRHAFESWLQQPL